MGLEAFRRIQIGHEGTPGTAVAATDVLLGTLGTWENANELSRPEEERNNLALYHENDEWVSKQHSVVWTGDVNYRHILYALLMSIRGNVTPTQPDPTNEPLAHLWTLTPASTAPNTPDQGDGIDTFTLEYGDDDACWRVPYCFGTSLEISGAPNEPCTFTLNIVGAEEEDHTFTASLTVPAVQRAPFNLAQFYIDAAGGTMGSTQKTGLLRGFTWTLNTAFAPFVTADGSLSYGAVSEAKKAVQLSLTYRWGSDADVERTAHDERATRLIRIELHGQEELDVGQDNPPYLQLDQAVRYENWPSWGEDEGASTFDVTAYGVYNATYARLFEVALLNSLSALPT